jgi:glycogen debranching enzyme
MTAPGYNPFGYHTGTVWPHDNHITAGGFRRYGFDREAATIAKGAFDAAERFQVNRLSSGSQTLSTDVAEPVAAR